ncbi:MAG: hypothetical protein JSW10_10495 [Pseudomonadota bacterium]|nr:MAG: hypothetical protein JSW10_10495 [Pseudomonadota bacterium]
MSRIKLDSESEVVEECFAVIYAPRRQRDRFPENCVEIMDSEQAAMDAACPGDKRYAARVLGPSRSSEGLRLYYLVCWLD